MGSGGGTCCVLVSKRQELLAEGVHVRTRELMLEVTGYRGLQGDTACGALGLGNWTLGKLGWMH